MIYKQFQIPRRLGPKRASNIRKLFSLDKSDPVTQYVVRRTISKDGKKDKSVAPRIQRLITPVTLQRKRQRIAGKVITLMGKPQNYHKRELPILCEESL